MIISPETSQSILSLCGAGIVIVASLFVMVIIWSYIWAKVEPLCGWLEKDILKGSPRLFWTYLKYKCERWMGKSYGGRPVENTNTALKWVVARATKEGLIELRAAIDEKLKENE